jgi:hypothetical protein
VQGLEAVGDAVEVGVVAGVLCVVVVGVDVDVDAALVSPVVGEVAGAGCVFATPLELCDELPHAASANVQARMSAARILICRCFGRGMSGSFPASRSGL